MNLEALFDHMRKTSRAAFQKHGRVVPVFMTLQPPLVLPLAGGWDSLEDKHRKLDLIRMTFKTLNVQMYGLAFEAWTASQPLERSVDVAKITPPSQRKDRTEAIFVTARERGGGHIGGIWEIIRDSQGNGTVTKFTRMDGVDEDIGAFGNMLSEDRTMQ